MLFNLISVDDHRSKGSHPMLLYSLIIVVCILSFISALAIFSALVVAGRNKRLDSDETVASDRFPAWNLHDRQFDEAALKRLADNV